jgi:hypothetical protein
MQKKCRCELSFNSAQTLMRTKIKPDEKYTEAMLRGVHEMSSAMYPTVVRANASQSALQ